MPSKLIQVSRLSSSPTFQSRPRNCHLGALSSILTLHSGHVSELRATLPVTIFISPNMPLDEEGTLVRQAPQEGGQTAPVRNIAPPGYGEHVLDQLYEQVDMNGMHSGLQSGMQTPAIQTGSGVGSGANTPFYALSRAGSAENLHSTMGMAVPPAALSSRLQNVSMEERNRNHSYQSLYAVSGPTSGAVSAGATTPHSQPPPLDSTHTSPPQSAPLSRQHSGESGANTGAHTPAEHVEVELDELSKVPSYATAVKTPAPRPVSMAEGALPDYETATTPAVTVIRDPMDTIPEAATETRPRPPRPQRRQTSMGFSMNNLFHHSHSHSPEEDLRRRRNLLHSRPY